jgi:hypothetical protein
MSLALAAACAEADLSGEEDVDVPGRKDGGNDGADEGATGDSSTAADGTAPKSEGGIVIVDGGDGGALRCAVKDGLDVYCLAPGQSFSTVGTITYGPGFPAGLPAMGIGKPGLGYIPADYPMTCVATPGTRGLSPPNNTAGGKICEVKFDNTNTGTVTGTASYVVTIPASTPLADYSFGLVASAGTTISEPAFYLRVAP